MIQSRTTYQLKFGKIDQAVSLFKRLPKFAATPEGMQVHYHLLTDISGPMYTLVEELTVPRLEDWEKGRNAVFNHPDFRDWFGAFEQVVEAGHHDLYTVEGECSEWSGSGVMVVRQMFRALKWQVHPAVALLQRYGALLVDSGVGRNPRCLTDLSGPLFRLVIEIETDGLSEWESHRRTMFRKPEFQVWFLQLENLVDWGSHEFFRVEV
jgi:hypothetical protein